MPYPIFRSIVLLACFTGVAIAQEQEPQTPADNPSAPQPSKDSPAGISIPDSPGAIERLQKAKEKEDQRQWKTAAEFYQETLAKYGQRVVPANINRNAGIYQYVGVARVIQERIAKWPDDGLNAYRAAYGQTAADLLASARRDDLAALENIFWTYFITDAGKVAGLRLMDAHDEAGRFAAAMWVGQRLLSLHPLLAGNRAMIVYRTALAAHWSGDSKTANSLLDELKTKHANDTGTIGGKDVLLVDALEAAIKSEAPQPTTRPGDADTWPSYGGLGGAGAVSSSTVKPGLNSINILLAPPNLNGMSEQNRRVYMSTDITDLGGGQALGVMPVVDGNALYFQDGRHVYAVSTDSGQPLPGWTQTYPGDRAGRYNLDVFGRARGEQLTLSLTPTQVLAIMGQADRQAQIAGQAVLASVRVVCLDRNSGKELWARAASDLPESIAALRAADFNGTPLVVPGDDSFLVFARGGKGNQFEDCYVVCLSLKNGQYKWSTYVGSASHMFDGDVTGELLGTSEMCLAEGRVFILTNLGVVAALDPYDGRMIWLSAYPRDVNDNPEQAAIAFRNRMSATGRFVGNKPWTNNPVVVTEGNVFALPTDGKHLSVFDAGTGEEVKRILLTDYDNADVLLGVKQGMAVLSTEKGCYCIDWRAYQHADPDRAIIWARKDVAVDMVPGEENIIFGRGFVTSDSVFLPSKHRLYQLGWSKGGKVMSMYPSRGKWDSDRSGNVLATSQGVIIAGSARVDVYFDRTVVQRQYEQRIAAAPNDPQPRIDFANALFAGGQMDAALAKLDEAIDLAGGIAHLRPGAGRDAIFTSTLNFAERAAKDPANDAAAITEKLYDRVAAAADSPLDQAMYRLSRARYLHNRKDFPAEVKLCQEVLSDDAMRAVPISENATAGAEAEAAINGAIMADRTAYNAIEQSAAAAVKTASAAGDPAQLLAVARIYPNSRAAAEARQAAAELLETAKQYEAAITTLREMYAATSEPAVRTGLLASIARNYLQVQGGVGAAVDRLAIAATRDQAERRLSQALRLPDGTRLQNLTVADAVTALRQIEAAEDIARLPDFHIPAMVRAKDKPFASADGAAMTIADVTTLVRPMREFARNDHLVAWSPTTGLSIFPVGETTPTATAPSVSGAADEPRGCAWLEGSKLLIWSDTHVTLFGETGGPAVWQADVKSVPLLAVAEANGAIDDEQAAADGAGQPGAVVVDGGFVVAPNGGRVIINGGRRFIVNGGQLRIIGQMNVAAGAPAGAPAPAAGVGEQIATVRPAGNRVVVSTSAGNLIAIDMKDGSIAWQTRLTANPLGQLLANARFTVARISDVAGSQLVVIDTPTGRVVGRRRFGPENSPTQLVNAALSEEGTLAWTTLTRLFVKDLYEPWRLAPVELAARATGETTNFAGLSQSDQLLVRGGRVIALYDSGKFVRVHDLARGGNDPAAPTGNPLATGADAANAPNVALRLVGPRLFVSNGKNLWQYNLASPDDHYSTRTYDLDYQPRIRELFLGQDHAILLNDPVDRGPLGSAFVQLLIHRRGPISATNSKEASNLDYLAAVNDKAGIFTWQPVDGGVYYLTGDHQLHFLQARR